MSNDHIADVGNMIPMSMSERGLGVLPDKKVIKDWLDSDDMVAVVDELSARNGVSVARIRAELTEVVRIDWRSSDVDDLTLIASELRTILENTRHPILALSPERFDLLSHGHDWEDSVKSITVRGITLPTIKPRMARNYPGVQPKFSRYR